MHYLFERRLNMLEIAVHALDDAQLADPGSAEVLLRDHLISVPDLDTANLKEGFHDSELAPGEGPEGFELRKTMKAYYYRATASLTDAELASDILPMRVCAEGLSITPKEAYYTEWSHEPLKDDAVEKQQLRARAEKAFADVQLTLCEFAANAVEFNQLVLPAAVMEKIQAERMFRFEQQIRRDEGKPVYSD